MSDNLTALIQDTPGFSVGLIGATMGADIEDEEVWNEAVEQRTIEME